MLQVPEGAWFGFQVNISESGKPKVAPMVERYTFEKIDGEDCTVAVECNGEPKGRIQTKTSYASSLFDFSQLEKKGSENINTNFGHFYANIYEGVVDGVSIRMYLGKDDIVFRRVISYNKGDALYSESREFCWSSIRI